MEAGLIAALLARNSEIDRVSRFLRPQHFSDPAMGEVYCACVELVERGKVADAASVSAFLGREIVLGQPADDAVQVAEAILDHHLDRRLGELADVLRAKEPILERLDTAHDLLLDIAAEVHWNGPQSFRACLLDALADDSIRRGKVTMVPEEEATDKVRALLSAYEGDTDALGRTKAVQGASVVWFTFGTDGEQLAADVAGFGTDDEANGELARNIQHWPLFIDDTPAPTLLDIRRTCRHLAQVHGLDIVIIGGGVDYRLLAVLAEELAVAVWVLG